MIIVVSQNNSNSIAPVLIAGGGIGGLVTALTLHQIGVSCVVFESVRELKPFGVGINLQPNAIRELYELGLGEEVLDKIGIQAREWALVGLNGNDIYTEPRGYDDGYKWPQYSVHRGELQMLLYQTVLERLGKDALCLGQKVTHYKNLDDGVEAFIECYDGKQISVKGSLLVGADGLHSAIRSQMYPNQPSVHWSGAVMWRGVSQAKPIRSGASFVGLGTHDHRFVFYPISSPDPVSSLATINWIAEITEVNTDRIVDGNWNKKVAHDQVVKHFSDWRYDWLDVPSLINGATDIYEYPMIDRDPIPTWQDGNVILLGDAAHVMYPVGSNGASQAIVDARVLGVKITIHGVNNEALSAYDKDLCTEISALVLRNRGSGPFEILSMVDKRCDGTFDNIDDVITPDELSEFMRNYKMAAGYAKESLNDAAPLIPVEARIN
jgi:5-methylphenazine-1-carboxylate 1-monooxygenase